MLVFTDTEKQILKDYIVGLGATKIADLVVKILPYLIDSGYDVTPILNSLSAKSSQYQTSIDALPAMVTSETSRLSTLKNNVDGLVTKLTV